MTCEDDVARIVKVQITKYDITQNVVAKEDVEWNVGNFHFWIEQRTSVDPAIESSQDESVPLLLEDAFEEFSNQRNRGNNKRISSSPTSLFLSDFSIYLLFSLSLSRFLSFFSTLPILGALEANPHSTRRYDRRTSLLAFLSACG